MRLSGFKLNDCYFAIRANGGIFMDLQRKLLSFAESMLEDRLIKLPCACLDERFGVRFLRKLSLKGLRMRVFRLITTFLRG